MIQREGRLASVQAAPAKPKQELSPPSMEISSWERSIFVVALIAILVLGGIAGLRSLMSMIHS